MESTKRRRELDDSLADDPFDLAARLERLLLAAACDDHKVANDDAAIFARLHLSPSSNRILRAIADGAVRIFYFDGIYVADPPSPTWLVEPGRAIKRSRDFLASELGRAVPVTWIDFHDASPYSNFTRIELGGVRHVTFSKSLLEAPDWESLVWHEVAHATLISNCRYLDEGWATLCQYRFGPATNFPLAASELGSFVIPDTIANISTADLLRYSGHDLAFGDLTHDEVERRAIFVRAHRFVDVLFRRLSSVAFCSLFDRVWAGEEPRSVVEEVAECGLELLDPGERSLRRQETPATDTSPVEERACGDMGKIRSALVAARVAGGSEELLGHLEILRSHVAKYKQDRTASRLRGQIIAELVLKAARVGENAELWLRTELDVVIEDLERQNAVAGAELLRAQKATAALLISPPLLKGRHMAAAQRHFEKAKSLAPNDGDLMLAFAKFELGKPRLMGARARALEYLNVAANDPNCREEANHVARLFELTEERGWLGSKT
jgi:hypothetical protein